MSDKVVIGPYWGEFGWVILHHVRYVEQHPAKEKVVVIERGMEPLYPSASEFFYYENPIPDSNRQNGGAIQHKSDYDEARKSLQDMLAQKYPEHEIIQWPKYDCHFHWSDLVKPRLTAEAKLPAVDIAVCARKRNFGVKKNWPHWQTVVERLREQGLTIGLVGHPDTSADVVADAKAWDHPDGATAGTVDMLANSKLLLTTDTGIAHLGALMDTPMVCFLGNPEDPYEMTEVISRANKRYCKILPKQAAMHPDWIVGAAIWGLRDANRPSQFYSHSGEDKWIVENLKLPEKGIFVEVGAANGVRDSNTYCFERAGWTGLVVEPDPRRHEHLRKNRRCKIDYSAVGTDPSAVFHQNNNADFSGFGRGGMAIPVTIKPLGTVLDDHGIGEIDLLSIDTEGTEADVWSSFDVEKHKPKVVLIEWNTVGLPDRRKEIRAAVLKHGYKEVHDIGGNLIFERIAA